MTNIKRHSVARAPYRISLGGGGTDLPFYAKKNGGYLITAAIDEYITVMVANRTLDDDIFIQYSEVERVKSTRDIRHNIIREVLNYFEIDKSFQVSTFSTMPTFTGLGASSTLIVALIRAIRDIKDIEISDTKLAEEAFYIERKILNLSGGFQDQYIASLGGIQIIEIGKDLNIKCKSMNLKKEIINELENKLFLIHSNIDRKSDVIIDSQINALKNNEFHILDSYDKIKDIGIKSAKCIRNRDWTKLAILMDNHWEIKKNLSDCITNKQIDTIYLELKSFGALGGKIIGAGGGGFFLMVVNNDIEKFKKKVNKAGYKFINYKIDLTGAHSLY